MTRRARTIMWGVAVLGGLTASGLGALVIAGDLEKADKAASIVGAVVGLASLAVSVISLLRSPAPAPAGDPATAGVRAQGTRSVAIGGNAGRIVTGDGVALSTPPPAPLAETGEPAGTRQPTRATGERAVAAGGSVDETITGDGPQS
ncbi:hypothetical protein ACFXA3_33150 [Streptomyces sp. NPDC059456]|uniref:hypothetical protein n=1 Tax=Streptomyces sp. NPDC059456 TaxID=3346838 RepID=UPI00369AF668